ncbi:ABC transporter substrate-binding protein [Embleya scabrispora]|uniref:ABC transporter substrate-binding protein n=1 Tax=Embleya scabrispora TaxID=159449 RepID=UPI00037A9EA6|nr:ABC transporter substrate-binding protein [Embleya scabrispora]MYS83880.1 ABC transporter substrate-binding protein [Streptomyces sp. SID5474]
MQGNHPIGDSRRAKAVRRAAAPLAVTVAAALMLAACGGAKKQSGDAQGDGGTLVVDTSFSLKTADPGRTFEPTGILVTRPVYDTLLTFAGGDVTKPVPLLAASYEAAPDAKTFTFPLRPEAKFSDGTPVTAKDVVFSFNRVKNLKGNPAFLLDGVTASAKDEHTVVLTTEAADPALPFRIATPALGVVNSKTVAAHGGTDAPGADQGDKAEQFLNSDSQGSGPYRITKYDVSSEVILTRNDNYWGAKPKYAKVVVRNVPANTQQLNVLSGESQISLDMSPDQAVKVKGQAQVLQQPTPTTAFLFSNDNPATSPTTSNKDFQEAVRYGLDYKSLLDVAGAGSAQAAGIVPSFFTGALDPAKAVQRDVPRAKAALARAGLNNPSVDLYYASDVTINGINFGDLGARVQANLKEVGITINLKPAPTQTALDSYRNGSEAMGLWWWQADYPDASDYLAFTPGELVALRAGWKADANAEVSGLAQRAKVATSDAERVQLYKQLQEAMNKTGPFMPLLQPAQVIAANNTVKNLHYNPIWYIDVDKLG